MNSCYFTLPLCHLEVHLVAVLDLSVVSHDLQISSQHRQKLLVRWWNEASALVSTLKAAVDKTVETDKRLSAEAERHDERSRTVSQWTLKWVGFVSCCFQKLFQVKKLCEKSLNNKYNLMKHYDWEKIQTTSTHEGNLHHL